MVQRRYQHALIQEQSLELKRIALLWVLHDCKVNIPALHHLKHLGSRAGAYPQMYARVAIEEHAHHADERVRNDVRRGRDLHRSPLLRKRSHGRQRVDPLHQRCHQVRKPLPSQCELYRTLHPVEQRHTKLFFQLLYMCRNRGLPQPQFARRP